MRILKSIVIIFGLLSLVGFSTNSYLTDEARVNDNEFSAGTWPTPTPSPPPFQQITICHATGAEKNPYVEITISEQGVLNGHLPHHDDIIPAPAGGCPTSLISGASVVGGSALVSTSPSPFGSPSPAVSPIESPTPTETPSPIFAE